jgi:hypothetical protein
VSPRQAAFPLTMIRLRIANAGLSEAGMSSAAAAMLGIRKRPRLLSPKIRGSVNAPAIVSGGAVCGNLNQAYIDFVTHFRPRKLWHLVVRHLPPAVCKIYK